MMLIAARESFTARSRGIPTAHDYVQQGLVFMWDGIENAGWHRHTKDTEAFRDLVAGRAVKVGNYGDPTASSAAPWTVTSTGIRSNTTSTTQSVGVAIPYTSTIAAPWCIECVRTIHSRDTANAWSSMLNYVPAASTGSSSSAKAHSVWINRSSLSAKIYYSGEGNISGGRIGLNFFHYGRHPGTGQDGTGTGPYNAAWFVHNQKAAYNGNWSSSYPVPSGVTHRVFCTGAGFDATLHNFRVYNRKLSKEEIAYNQSIDEERFGLP